jgi:formate hydrogenlyase subunit 3/multisubunit Na+/H+ antiporter MnhD subunit
LIAYILIFIGAIGKIGLIPFHWWTLKLTRATPITIYTIIPMIIEKIISIYLLIRLSYYIFNIGDAVLIRILILGFGGLSIIIACLMALKTDDAYKLLNYASITQVGFILIGIGCTSPLGYASAMLNTVNYLLFQPSLLLTAGSIEYWTKTTNLNSFEGMASKMPISFFACLFAVLALCGVPPMNGFFSKWLMFDAIYTISPNGLNLFSIVLIIISIFGCMMTTIYLLKFILAFQGSESKSSPRVRDPGFTMWSTTILLSTLCFILGIFALSLSWRTFIFPSVNNVFPQSFITNPWIITPAPFILIISIVAGIIIYYTKRHIKVIK